MFYVSFVAFLLQPVILEMTASQGCDDVFSDAQVESFSFRLGLAGPILAACTIRSDAFTYFGHVCAPVVFGVLTRSGQVRTCLPSFGGGAQCHVRDA